MKFSNSYLTYYFCMEEDTLVMRGSYVLTDKACALFFPPGVREKICRINLTPRDLSYFDEHFDAVYTDHSLTPFHRSLRIIRHNKEDGKALVIKDASRLFEDEEHFLEVTQLASLESFLSMVEDLFPLLIMEAHKAVDRLGLFN